MVKIHRKYQTVFLGIIMLALSFGLASQAQAADVYFSVGQNTNDHKTGSPTITVSGLTATLSVGQTAANMGVGDKITYTGGSCYISGKNSATSWNCTNATGGTAPQVSNVSVTSIAHVFSSLSAAIAGADDLIGNTDLTAAGVTLYIPCYYDSGSDSATASVSGYTTSSSYFIKIYTPYDTTNQVNQSQRHTGKWTSSAYNLSVTGNSVDALTVAVTNVYIEGLQISIAPVSTSYPASALALDTNTLTTIFNASDNIITASGAKAGTGMDFYEAGTASLYVWNNIVYNFNGATSSIGIRLYDSSMTGYVYNNTVASCYAGLKRSNGTFIAKNNIVYSATDAYYGIFSSSSGYNATDGTDNIGYGSNNLTSRTFSFVDSANYDFHLTSSDTGAQNAGADLSSDTPAVTKDINEESRPTGSSAVDIGADEYVAPAASSGTIYIKSLVNFGINMFFK